MMRGEGNGANRRWSPSIHLRCGIEAYRVVPLLQIYTIEHNIIGY